MTVPLSSRLSTCLAALSVCMCFIGGAVREHICELCLFEILIVRSVILVADPIVAFHIVYA